MEKGGIMSDPKRAQYTLTKHEELKTFMQRWGIFSRRKTGS